MLRLGVCRAFSGPGIVCALSQSSVLGPSSPALPHGGGCGPAGLRSVTGDPRGGEQQLRPEQALSVVTPRTSCPWHWAGSQRALKVIACLSAPQRPKQSRGLLSACAARGTQPGHQQRHLDQKLWLDSGWDKIHNPYLDSALGKSCNSPAALEPRLESHTGKRGGISAASMSICAGTQRWTVS
ncbi:uncharacterized protein LOC111945901 isoform X3 [Cyanistes caeruleus]|uniref:uncharacterized protein LOC111945901 isoform X3 n=1 Tax=Cyanistes caeruleus TaxID=156563 RepID=UPI000CDB6573|nr:uncharacterized protein LOC111945901 isoform X3 [Cyanistes caeruleus]